MCPFCLATAALLAVGTASTGGLTAFAMNNIFALEIKRRKIIQHSNQRRTHHDAETNRTSKSRVTSRMDRSPQAAPEERKGSHQVARRSSPRTSRTTLGQSR